MDEFEGFSRKQIDVIKQGYAKLTILTGGVRGGKTFLTYFDIPDLIARFPHSKGIIIGKTLASLSENVLEPMRELFGEKAISGMKSDASGKKYCVLFGKRIRCVGANDGKAVDKIRGSTYAWAVGDEVSTWDKATFDMLMSRLSEKGAICVVTTNPDEPSHWFNQNYILKNDIDKSIHTFTIDDNPYLDPEYVENLKNIYRGTVLYDRLILGKWASGSGAIYKRFITEEDRYVVDNWERNDLVDYAIGIDFGENVSATTFKLLGLQRNYNGIVVLEEEHIKEHKDTKLLQDQFITFLKKCLASGWRIDRAYYDCAQKTLGESLKSAVAMAGLPCIVEPCIKEKITERIQQEIVLFGAYRLHILKRCEWSIKAFKEAVYKENKEERLDEVSPENPVDDLDAIEYAFYKWSKNLMARALYGGESR